MQCTISTKDFDDIMGIVVRFISKNTTLPILQNVYLQITNDTLLVRATNMEKYVEITRKVENTVDGSLTIEAKTLFDIVKSITEEYIEMKADNENDMLTVKTSKDIFKLKWIPATEYVALPELQSTKNFFIDANILSTWFRKVSFAVLEKNFSPLFTGIYIHTKKESDWNKVCFVWTDSFVLTEYKTDIEEDLWDLSVIIPKQASSDIEYIASLYWDDENNKIKFELSSNLIWIECDYNDMNIKMMSILIQWTFPDYENENIMPKEFNITVNVDSKKFDSEIKKVWILSTNNKNLVSLNIHDDKIHILAWKQDRWTWDTWINIQKEWEDISLYLNWKYFNDYIRELNSDSVKLNIVNNVMPIVVTNDDEPNYKMIVRPLKQ